MITEINPIPELCSQSDYEILTKLRLLNHNAVRDYIIRRDFQNMDGKPVEKVNVLKGKFTYLQKETLKKIIYKKLK